jgi:putative membrane protein
LLTHTGLYRPTVTGARTSEHGAIPQILCGKRAKRIYLPRGARVSGRRAGTQFSMLRLLLNWILSALALLIVARIVPGIYVRSFWAALWAALAIGLVNATLGLLLKVITFPLTVFTLGIFWLVINALMLELATIFVPGFRVSGFIAAFFGSIMLSLVNIMLRWLAGPHRAQY